MSLTQTFTSAEGDLRVGHFTLGGYRAGDGSGFGAVVLLLSGDYTGLTFTIEAQWGGGPWVPLPGYRVDTYSLTGLGGVSPEDGASLAWIAYPHGADWIRFRPTALAGGTVTASWRPLRSGPP